MSEVSDSRAPFASAEDEPKRDDTLAAAAWEHCAAGLCLIGADGRVFRSNPAFARTLGYEPDELQGLPLSRLHPPDTGMQMRALHHAVLDNDPLAAELAREMRFLHRRGRPVAAYARNTRIASVDGNDGGAMRLITLVDIAEIARGDRQLQLVQRAENFGALASAIANDLNNLLSIILGYTALLREGAAGTHRPRVVADGVESAVRRAGVLVRQTLYLARRPEAQLVVVSLTDFVERRVQHLRALQADRPVELSITLRPELQQVPIDTSQLAEAFDEVTQRLLPHDADPTRPLRVHTDLIAGTELRERLDQAIEPAYAMIEISHPGKPRNRLGAMIDGEEAEPRAQRHDLGLTMVERIIESHHGFVRQELTQDGGVQFTLFLPLGQASARPEPEVAPPVASSRPKTAGTLRILVVDDEKGLLDTIVATLKRFGHDVWGALDGETAMTMYREAEGRFDLVLCDLVLPGMSGWEVFTAMRELRPDIAVMIMSGHLEPKLEAAVHRSGAAGFLQKPFTITMLLRRLRELTGLTGFGRAE